MRFHKFQTITDYRWIDLDAINVVEPRDGVSVLIWCGCGNWEVFGSCDDVLALVSPPAAPDTYEADLRGFGAASHSAADGLEDRPMTAEDDPNEALIRTARLDEIRRLEEDIAERMGFVPERLRTAFDWRRESIRKYGV